MDSASLALIMNNGNKMENTQPLKTRMNNLLYAYMPHKICQFPKLSSERHNYVLINNS